MGYKTTDGLMRHLRSNGVDIGGTKQKRQLINTGYYHGYKGYRFFKNSQNKLPFISYNEVYLTIQYDSKLKAILYEKIIFIETAVKNISLESILKNARSENIHTICERVLMSYNDAPLGSNEETKRRLQLGKLNLKKSIEIGLANAYQKNNPKITHFYNSEKSGDVPIWALFEIFTLGDFGRFLSCLKKDVREDISNELGLNTSMDTNKTLIYKYIYILKDLRNAIAHNAVVYDVRFISFTPNKPMKKCLVQEIGLPYANFNRIEDFIILICYFLKLLKIPNKEINIFIKEYELITEKYMNQINKSVTSITVNKDLKQKLEIVKKYVQKD